MFKIRYYSQTFEPRQFGRLIRFVNWVRYWIETLVQYLVLRSLLKEQLLTRKEKKDVLKVFRQDVRSEIREWDSAQTPAEEVLSIISETHSKQDSSRGLKPLDETGFDRYLTEGRAKRYALRSRVRYADDVVDDESPQHESPPVPEAGETEAG